MAYASKPGYMTVGHKQYEISNHMGNVLAVVSDRIHMRTDSTWAEVLSRTDYYPFGLEMTGRTESNGYRYGFNGKEKDSPGIGGGGSTYDYGFRIYNPTIGKFLSVDPLADHPNQIGMSPYSAFWNNPIRYNDPDGRCPDCPDPSKAKEGDVANPNGGMNFTFSGGEWTGDGGTLDGVTVTASRTENGGTDFDNANLALTAGGAIYGGLEGAAESQGYWLGENGKYYPQRWGGNQHTGSRAGAFRAASAYKLAGRATIGGSAILGATMTYQGYIQDGGEFGYNAQRAAAGSTGSILGGMAGAKAGVLLGGGAGALIGGVGAIPGAVIGGIVGGFGLGIGGGYLGGHLGEKAVDHLHKP